MPGPQGDLGVQSQTPPRVGREVLAEGLGANHPICPQCGQASGGNIPISNTLPWGRSGGPPTTSAPPEPDPRPLTTQTRKCPAVPPQNNPDTQSVHTHTHTPNEHTRIHISVPPHGVPPRGIRHHFNARECGTNSSLTIPCVGSQMMLFFLLKF